MPNKRRRRRRSRVGLVLAVAVTVLAMVAAVAVVTNHLADRMHARQYPVRFEQEIRLAAAEFGIDPAYVAGLVLVESSYDPAAHSHADARGLMQMLPSTGEWIAGKLDVEFSEALLFDPGTNLRLGCWYLRYLIDRFDGDVRCATAAYHAGQGTVDRWLADPSCSLDGRTLRTIPSSATNTYVNRVLENYEEYQKIY